MKFLHISRQNVTNPMEGTENSKGIEPEACITFRNWKEKTQNFHNGKEVQKIRTRTEIY